QLRWQNNHPGGQLTALWAGARLCTLLKGRQLIEKPVVGALVIVDGHGTYSLSLDKGTSIAPDTFAPGPSALGLSSISKISVGNQNVAQALGISTTPLMCPCTGAQPRMA